MSKNINFLNNNSTANITSNFERVNTALEDVVSRSGELPNSMGADLDMDSNDILNVNSVQANTLIVNGIDLTNVVNEAFLQAERAEDAADRSDQSATNAALYAALSEYYKNITAGYASDAVSQGNVPLYSTHVGLSALSIPAGILSGYLWGYYENGDGGGKVIRRVDAEPSHLGKVRSADRFTKSGGETEDATNGGWWETAEPYPHPLQFGAKAEPAEDGAIDDDAFAALESYAPGRVINLRGLTYRLSSFPAGAYENGHYWIDFITYDTEDILLSKIGETQPVHPIDLQPTQVLYDFTTAGALQTTDIVPTVINNDLNISVLTENAGTSTIGVRTASAYGPNVVAGSEDYPVPSFAVGMDTLTDSLDENSYSLEFSVSVPAGRIFGLHRLHWLLGYDSIQENGTYYEVSSQLYMSDDGTTWAAVGSTQSLGSLAAKFAYYAASGSGGAHYVSKKAILLSNGNNTVFIPGGTTKYFRLALAKESGTISNTRRAEIGDIKLEGTVFADLSADGTIVNGIVDRRTGIFSGWPANYLFGYDPYTGRMFQSYSSGDWVDNPSGHDQDYDTNYTRTAQSFDNGITWTSEAKANLVLYADVDPGDIIPRVSLDLTNPELLIQMEMQYRWHSLDFGETWSQPSFISGTTAWDLEARSSMIVTGEDTAFLFMTGHRRNPTPEQEDRNRASVWRTTTGGQTWNYTQMIGPENMLASIVDPSDAYSIMPRAVRVAPDWYILSTRDLVTSHKGTTIWESRDAFASRIDDPISRVAQDADNGHALLHLGGSELVLVYCSRQNGPKGLCMAYSPDLGRRWSIPAFIRTDGASWDLGYPNAVVLANGWIHANFYYHTAALPHQGIYYARVNPDLLRSLPLMPIWEN